jgi:hypothetical protein
VKAIRFLLRFGVVFAGVLLLGAFLFLVVQRFRNPVELEWSGGAVLEHVERVRQGKPLYVPASADYVPLQAPPLGYWITALLGKWMSLGAAARALATFSTLLAGLFVYLLARALEARRFWALAGVSLFFGAYALSGLTYDVERSEMLAVAMVLGATWIACRWPGGWGFFFAGIVAGFAFFANQNALAFVVWPAFTLLVARRWRRAGALLGGGGVGFAPLWSILHQTSDGWFTTYCIKLPAQLGIERRIVASMFTHEMGRGLLLVVVTLVALGVWVRSAVASMRGDDVEPQYVYFGSSLFAAFAASIVSRLHQGSGLETLAFWSSFACVAVGWLGTRLEEMLEHDEDYEVVVSGATLAVGAQLLHLAYDPRAHAPDAATFAVGRSLASTVRHLESAGEVIVPGHGLLTSRRHFHAAALADYVHAGQKIPDDIPASIDDRKYAAFVADALPDETLLLGDLDERLARAYFVAARLDDRDPTASVGPGHQPGWVLRPRARPLAGMSAQQLQRRRKIEMALAEHRMRLAQAGVHEADDGAEIEDAAKKLDESK